MLIQLDPDLARTEPDPEIQDLIRASGGLNVALDYLPGAVTFDPVTHRPAAALASAIVWFDAFVTNVDRTARNTNMLMWHRQLHLIDHGAALYFHHSWSEDYLERSRDPFPRIRDHVLLPFAGALQEAHESMLERLTPQVMRSLVALIPDELLAGRYRRSRLPASFAPRTSAICCAGSSRRTISSTEALRAHAQLV